MTTEEWRPIPDYEGVYEASNLGRVRSVATGLSRLPVGHVMSPCVCSNGYLYLRLTVEGNAKKRYVHRLVTAAFIGPLPQGMVTRHLNGDALDNRLANLTYGTYTENNRDIVRHGRHHQARRTHCDSGHEFTADNTLWHHGVARAPYTGPLVIEPVGASDGSVQAVRLLSEDIS